MQGARERDCACCRTGHIAVDAKVILAGSALTEQGDGCAHVGGNPGGMVGATMTWLSAQEPSDIWATIVFVAAIVAIIRVVSIIRSGR